MGYFKDDSGNYKTADWLEEKREQYKKLGSKVETITREGDVRTQSDYDKLAYLGEYKKLFDLYLDDILHSKKRKPTVYEYYIFYTWILEQLTTIVLIHSLYTAIEVRRKLSMTYEDIHYAFDLEKYKLEYIFSEFLKNDNNYSPVEIIKTRKLKAWQKYLSEEKGMLYPDGERVVKGLENTVLEYVKFTKKDTTWRFVQANFLKPNGLKYSEKQCQNAVAYSNSNS